MQKEFNHWNSKKKSIHAFSRRPFYQEREVWWASLGANIGDEEDGKNSGFERPILIFKKFNRNVFWALPLTTQIKSGKYYFTYTRNDMEFAAILSQLRLLDAKRLKRKIYTLPIPEFKLLKEKFLQLFI
jgi:mRNA interferase MazF